MLHDLQKGFRQESREIHQADPRGGQTARSNRHRCQNLCDRRAENLFRAPLLLPPRMTHLRQLILPGLAVGLLVAGCRGLPARRGKIGAAGFGGGRRTTANQFPRPFHQRDVARLRVVRGAEPSAGHRRLRRLGGAVENITVARSLPDPKLTFELYAGDALTSLMPGLTADIPGPGKLSARGAAAVGGEPRKIFSICHGGAANGFRGGEKFLSAAFP